MPKKLPPVQKAYSFDMAWKNAWKTGWKGNAKGRAIAATVHSIVGSQRVHIDTSALADSSIDIVQYNSKNLSIGSRKLPSFAEVDD